MAKIPNSVIKARNIAENFNHLSRAHERYRQTTDGRAIAYSERELEFTFAKKASELCMTSVALAANAPVLYMTRQSRNR